VAQTSSSRSRACSRPVDPGRALRDHRARSRACVSPRRLPPGSNRSARGTRGGGSPRPARRGGAAARRAADQIDPIEVVIEDPHRGRQHIVGREVVSRRLAGHVGSMCRDVSSSRKSAASDRRWIVSFWARRSSRCALSSRSTAWRSSVVRSRTLCSSGSLWRRSCTCRNRVSRRIATRASTSVSSKGLVMKSVAPPYSAARWLSRVASVVSMRDGEVVVRASEA
jgi:hypothetical protein